MRISRASRRVFQAAIAAALGVSAMTGCQLLFGIEERETAPPPDGGQDSGLRQCEAAAIDATFGDWTCVRWESISYPERLRVSGRFYSPLAASFELTRFETCLFSPEAMADAGGGWCQDSQDALCEIDGTIGFEVEFGRGEHGEIEWQTSEGNTTAGTMWTAPSARSSADVGTVPLLGWTEVVWFASSVEVEQADDRGMLFVSVRDCAAVLTRGVYVAAFSDGRATGTPFALHNSIEPRVEGATDDSGLAGVFNTDTGWVTVQAFLPDDCLVAEASLFVSGGEITYLDMIPAASEESPSSAFSCPEGAGGQGGSGP